MEVEKNEPRKPTDPDFTYRDIVKRRTKTNAMSLYTLVEFIISEGQYRKKKLFEIRRMSIALCIVVAFIIAIQCFTLYFLFVKF